MSVHCEKVLTRTSEKFLQWRECPINIGVTLQSVAFGFTIHSALEQQII